MDQGATPENFLCKKSNKRYLGRGSFLTSVKKYLENRFENAFKPTYKNILANFNPFRLIGHLSWQQPEQTHQSQ